MGVSLRLAGVVVSASIASACVQACSSADPSATVPMSPADAGPPQVDAAAPKLAPDAGNDDGAPSSVYPAPHAPPRSLVRLSGPVLAHPTVIPVFFDDDVDQARTLALLASLPGSAYWGNLAEYGVGDVTIGAAVSMGTTAPAKFSLAGIDAAVSALWTRADAPAPTPDGTQIYAMFFPTQTTVNQADGSPFCKVGGAYHDSHGTEFAYAVVPRCEPTFDNLGVSATHELIEAATDPYPLVKPAWAAADPGHVADRGEVGDLCDYGGSLSGTGFPLFGTMVERVFSNARAQTGHDPCIPDIGFPYFGASPVASDDVMYQDVSLGIVKGKGRIVKLGETKTVDLQLFSDRDLAAWSVSVQVIDVATQQPSTALTTSLDRPKGVNGEKLHLSVKRIQASDSGELVKLLSISRDAYWTDSFFVSP